MTNTTMPPLLLSLKPCYAELVFEGLKTAELRRRIALDMENRDVFIYVSSPAMELRGGFRVGQVWRDTPDKVWDIVSELARVEKQDFDTYFAGKTVACAFEIREVWEYENPVSLNMLREQFPNFVVPQSWRYVRDDEHLFFKFFRQTRMKPTKEAYLEKHQVGGKPLRAQPFYL